MNITSTFFSLRGMLPLGCFCVLISSFLNIFILIHFPHGNGWRGALWCSPLLCCGGLASGGEIDGEFEKVASAQ